MLKAVIFDMDGVIIDSEPLHAKAAILALTDYGVSLTTEYCYSFIGSTAKHMLEVIRETYHLTASIEELMEANAHAKHKLVQEEGYPAIPHVYELMQELSSHGLKLAIASSSPYEDILATVQRLQLEPFLTHIVSGMQVAHPKPAPDIFLAAAAKLRVHPSECVVIEDSYNGVSAARAAGMAVLGFANPNSGNQDLWKAHCLCKSFKAIDSHFLIQLCQRANGEPVTIGETERLYLQELAAKNLSELQRIYTNPKVTAYLPDLLCSDSANAAAELLSYQTYAYGFYGYGLWGIFRKADHQLLGYCGLRNTTIAGDTELELGYLLNVTEWNNGYALEAARFVLNYAQKELEVNRIVAVIALDNQRSIRLAEKLGMRPEKRCCYQGFDCILYVYDGAEV